MAVSNGDNKMKWAFLISLTFPVLVGCGQESPSARMDSTMERDWLLQPQGQHLQELYIPGGTCIPNQTACARCNDGLAYAEVCGPLDCETLFAILDFICRAHGGANRQSFLCPCVY
jgi:hypothetical protein